MDVPRPMCANCRREVELSGLANCVTNSAKPNLEKDLTEDMKSKRAHSCTERVKILPSRDAPHADDVLPRQRYDREDGRGSTCARSHANSTEPTQEELFTGNTEPDKIWSKANSTNPMRASPQANSMKATRARFLKSGGKPAEASFRANSAEPI